MSSKTLEHRFGVELAVLGNAHTERNVFEVTKYSAMMAVSNRYGHISLLSQNWCATLQAKA
ncbi:MAG: hypothetical protein IPL11_06685 [Candidatus Accumulibacter sp.]|nr:hypothetical protein [Accumulibacter sp.]